MKKLFIILVITMMTSAVSFAQSTRYQRGYVKKNGTYVTGHYKTQSDRTNHNNFSTISNTNPYTGSRGSRAKDYSSGAYNYGRGKTIHTGSMLFVKECLQTAITNYYHFIIPKKILKNNFKAQVHE